jgi:hypothetical protein
MTNHKEKAVIINGIVLGLLLPGLLVLQEPKVIGR